MEGIDGLSLALQTLITQFVSFLPKLVAALVIFIVGLYLAHVATRLVRRALERRELNAEATQVISQITRSTLYVLVAVTALQQVDFNLTAFITGLGIVGFTLGFALQDISENFIAGLMLLLQRPFDLGDVVQIDDFRGRVTDVSLRATEVETLDGETVILPNSLVYTNPIINYTRGPLARISVEVGVAYDSDLDHVRRTALDAVVGIPHVLEAPEPLVAFRSFGDSSINFTLLYWVNGHETSQFRASNLIIPVIKEAFEREGIDIPFPIRTVLMPQPQAQG
jgi:small conductance mechanosensitive channel